MSILIRKYLAAACLTGSLVASPLSFAEEKASAYTGVKQGGVFFTSAIAGAVAGGPIGFVVGALGGAWLGEEIRQADQLQEVNNVLLGTEQTIAALQARVVAAEQNVEHYAQLALDYLQMDMLFKTDASELTLSAKQRMIQLVDFMVVNPDVSMRLDGYADPRGKSEHNLQLSVDRVNAVVNHLHALGLPPERISRFSHGDQLSQASRGDLGAYALERLVRIQLTRGEQAKDMAQILINQ